MDVKSLKSLVDSLERRDHPAVKLNRQVEAVDVSPSAVVGYVWPALRDWHDEPGAGVLLIEAAGAVGKTSAATALASELNWPLVNAARAQVGSYSLSGLIHDALGFESAFLGEVASGRSGVIVDALDEAHLRAGTLNFLAFLENVNRLAGFGRSRPSIVLFSRPDTAQLVRLFFSESGSPISSATIDFFDYGQACLFLGSYMNGQHAKYPRRNYGVVNRHPVPFAEMRDAIMCEIASALLSQEAVSPEARWSDVSTFLGYAPVLAVLAEYLAVPNPKQRATSALGETASAVEILLKIVDNLLYREQEKFQVQVMAKLRAELSVAEEWTNPDATYSPQEQILRLVARTLGLNFVIDVPVGIPASIRGKYEDDASSQFILDHPFLADRAAVNVVFSDVNVVFSDYIQAKSAVDLECLASLTPSPQDQVKNVGPFFYQFVHEFASSADAKSTEINEVLVSAVIDSYTQSTNAIPGGIMVYFQSGEEAHLSLPENLYQNAGDTREFQIVDLSGLLELSERITRAVIFTDGAIRISGQHGRFILGPYVHLRCNELLIDVDNISVDSSGREGSLPSTIRAEGIEANGSLCIDSPDPKAFQVVGSHHIGALIPYLVDKTDYDQDFDYEDYLTLRSILRRFSQGVGPFPSVYYELMEQRVVKDNPLRRRYLNRLRELDIVYLKDSHYYLNTTVLSRHGISLQSIVGGNPSDSVLGFIRLLNERQ